MKKISKNRKQVNELIDIKKSYSLNEAIDLIKQTSKANFNETVDISINLSLSNKKNDQSIKGAVNLPNGIGKKIKVAVIAKGSAADEATSAGADIVGNEDLIKNIENNDINFDRLISTPDMMKDVGKLGQILGPRGLMPNPKLGTVTNDVKKAVTEAKQGQIHFKNDKSGIIHAGIGKVDFEKEKLLENIKFFYETVIKNKPESIKGSFIKRVSIASTMGKGIKLNVAELQKS